MYVRWARPSSLLFRRALSDILLFNFFLIVYSLLNSVYLCQHASLRLHVIWVNNFDLIVRYYEYEEEMNVSDRLLCQTMWCFMRRFLSYSYWIVWLGLFYTRVTSLIIRSGKVFQLILFRKFIRAIYCDWRRCDRFR